MPESQHWDLRSPIHPCWSVVQCSLSWACFTRLICSSKLKRVREIRKERSRQTWHRLIWIYRRTFIFLELLSELKSILGKVLTYFVSGKVLTSIVWRVLRMETLLTSVMLKHAISLIRCPFLILIKYNWKVKGCIFCLMDILKGWNYLLLQKSQGFIS